MKKITFLLILTSLAFGGRLGIGISGGGQYLEDYETLTPERLETLFYGAKFNIKAEALPNVFLEPSIGYVNNPSISQSATGIGLGMTIKPKLGNFPIVPSFGLEGTLLFYNEDNIADAIRAGQLEQYIKTSTPELMGAGFAGLSLFLGKSISIDCTYSYHKFSPQYGVEMIWAGVSYYINW